jgi:putative transposase
MPVLTDKYRIYPNTAQVVGLTGMLGAFCDLDKACLQQRIEAYQRQGKTLNFYDQANELKAVRAVDERLAGFSFSAEQQVVRRLDKAFKVFFGRVKKDKCGFPRFQAKSRWDSAEFRVGDGLTIRKTKRIGIVGIPGQIKVKWHRDIPADAKVAAAVLSRSCGKWYVCFQIAVPELYGPWPDKGAVGIDVGLSSLIATSDGETVATPQFTKDAAKKQRRLQRALARCKRASKGRLKAKRNLARHSARTANQRRDFAHKLSRDLIDRHSLIAVEDLNVSGLARAMLAKSVHNAAWTQLRTMIEYKAAGAGVRVIAVNPRGTSQTCPECGAVAVKTLATRVHNCTECDCVMDRDVAAAKVILHRACPELRPGVGLGASSVRVAA